jgi:hypothetical protein
MDQILINLYINDSEKNDNNQKDLIMDNLI